MLRSRTDTDPARRRRSTYENERQRALSHFHLRRLREDWGRICRRAAALADQSGWSVDSYEWFYIEQNEINRLELEDEAMWKAMPDRPDGAHHAARALARAISVVIALLARLSARRAELPDADADLAVPDEPHLVAVVIEAPCAPPRPLVTLAAA